MRTGRIYNGHVGVQLGPVSIVCRRRAVGGAYERENASGAGKSRLHRLRSFAELLAEKSPRDVWITVWIVQVTAPHTVSVEIFFPTAAAGAQRLVRISITPARQAGAFA